MMIEKINQYIYESGKSQSKVAQAMGISAPMLSQYLSGKYPNPESVEAKAKEFFSIIEKSASIAKVQNYVDTSVSKQVYDIISYSHSTRSICIVVGDAGIGKTKAAMKYVSDYSEAIYITASKACKGLRDMYKMIARKLKINESCSLYDLQMSIREKLDGSSKLIIIDEAQHLSVPAIDGIRCLNDEYDNENESEIQPVGIVFIGNHELRTKIMGKHEQSLAQLFSRIQMQKLLMTKDVQVSDIELLFPEYLKNGMEKEVKFLHGIAQSRWGVRGAVKVFQNASNNCDISLKGLMQMTKYMGIGLGN